MRDPAPLKIATNKRPETASQSLLARIDVCPFSGALYILHKGGPQTAEMARGEAFHDFAARATHMLMEQGEPMMPGDVGRDLMQAVIEERTDLALPNAEQDVCRLAAWNWSEATVLDLDAIVGVEMMLTVEIAGWTVRGKLDRAEIIEGCGYVRDYKTSLYIPPREEFEKDFQTNLYALLMAEGTPEGDEVPIGRGLDVFRTFNIFPRLRREDGSLVDRDATLTRPDVADTKRTIEAHLAKLETGLSEGAWIASAGSHCHTCPASSECPIPPQERDRTIGTEGDAIEVGERIIRLEDELKGLKKSEKGWVSQNGPVRVGDYVFELVYLESESIRDKDGLKDALDAAGLDPADFYKTKESTSFKKRKLKPEEIA